MLPVAEIGKPPDVSEPDSEAEAGEKKLNGVVPASAVLVHRRVFTEVIVRNVLQGVTLGEARLCLQTINFKKTNNNIRVRISDEARNGFWIMDGREDGIYWKSSFLSFHDMVTLPFAGWSEKRMITLIGARCTIGNMTLHFITLQLTLH